MHKKLSLYTGLTIALAIILGGALWKDDVFAATLSRPANNLGLVGWWKFDEGTSTIAHDFSGNGLNGTLTNMDANTDWVDGRRGKALNFDGSNDAVSLGNPTALRNLTTGDFTVSAWMRTSDTSSRGVIFGSYNGITPNFNFEVYTTGKMRYFHQSGDDFQGTRSDMRDGQWHQVTMIRDSVNDQGYIYIDGVLDKQNAIVTADTAVNGSTTFYIGNDTRLVADPDHNGDIDDVRVYNRALSAAEIANLYQTSQGVRKQVSQNGLVGWWKFDEGTSTIAHDFSGNGFNGTVSGTALWTAGKKGGALELSSLSDRIEIPYSATLAPTTYISFGGWVYLSSTTANQRLMSKTECGGWQIGINDVSAVAPCNTTSVCAVAHVNGAYKTAIITPSSSLNAGQWYHLFVTYDGTAVRGYLDGVQTNSTSATGPMTYSNSNPLCLGGEPGSGTPCRSAETLRGRMDDLRIYSRALSATEVLGLYQEGQTVIGGTQSDRLASGLVGYWPFNGKDMNWASGIALDRSGQGNNGTLSNMTNADAAPGKVGQALQFNMASTSVSIGNPTILKIYQGTISAWIKTDNAGSSYRGIVQKGSAYGLYLKDNIFGVYDNGAAVFRSTGIALNDNKWHHVLAILDSGVTNGTSLYIDGQFVTSVTQTVGTQFSNVAIGAGQGAGQIFGGSIDEVRIYDRAVTADEARQLYLLGR